MSKFFILCKNRCVGAILVRLSQNPKNGLNAGWARILHANSGKDHRRFHKNYLIVLRPPRCTPYQERSREIIRQVAICMMLINIDFFPCQCDNYGLNKKTLRGTKMINTEKNLAERAKKWFSSQEGKESLKKAVDRALQNAEIIKKRRQLTPEILKKQFTI
jgi:hypothetical protein